MESVETIELNGNARAAVSYTPETAMTKDEVRDAVRRFQQGYGHGDVVR